MKKVYIIHSWGADSKSDWIPWLKKELENKDFEIHTPDMPETDEPIIEKWVGKLEELLPNPDENCILIGHSIGCQTIMRYLQNLDNKKIDKIVLVAPWFNLKGLENEELPIAKPWLETLIDFDKVKEATKDIVCLFSDNDPVVPVEDEKLFKEKLGAKTIIFSNKGHFKSEDGIIEIPEILEFIK
ncbi:alpha/beta fold hydrolase [Patescibacteria group bacterium]|nr:alpha/beta fold hydrolase [Patescibacteria group bacterium]